VSRRFFVPDGAVSGGQVVIAGPDAEHLRRSLRVRPGEHLVVADPAGAEHGVEVTEVTPREVRARVVWSRPATGESATEVWVIHALPKQDFADVIDGLAQMGVTRVLPAITDRTVVRPEPERGARRVDRWREVARLAAGVAGRGVVPEVAAPAPLSELLAGLPEGAQLLACVVDGNTRPIASAVSPGSGPVVICIGPEGDLSATDMELLEAAGATSVHLGPRVLRTVLAGVVAAALVMAATGELDRAWAAPPANLPPE
jgi:16S rRNA (uracil1498-N3)-methyltransferase